MEERAAASRLLVVSLKSDAQQVAQIVGILERLEIAADVLTTPAASLVPAAPPAVILRVPPGQVVEAVLALNYHGFGDVRAYEAEHP